MVISSSVRTCAQNVREIDEFFAVQVATLDPDAVPLGEVIELFTALEVIKRRAESTMVLLARRVEDAGRWRSAGCRSAADQLATLSGSSITAAKSMLETSKNVANLPLTQAALRNGELSSAKVQVIAAAASVDRTAEAGLLEGAADMPLAQVRDDCLRARGKDSDAAYARIHKHRSCKDFVDAEGAWNLMVRGTADAGQAFRRLHRPIVDELFKAARAEGRHEPPEVYAYDAFMELVRRGADEPVAEEANEATATEPSDAAAPAKAKTKKKKAKATPAEYLGLIRVDHAALVRGWVEGDELCEIAGLGPIPVSVARERLSDAILKLVLTKGVDVANVTHLGRSVTVAQEVALLWQGPECTRLGCTRTYWLENDHREDWAKTKHTRLDETDKLCDHDHDLKTYQGWALVAGTGKRPMVPPTDPRHPKNRPPPKPE